MPGQATVESVVIVSSCSVHVLVCVLFPCILSLGGAGPTFSEQLLRVISFRPGHPPLSPDAGVFCSCVHPR